MFFFGFDDILSKLDLSSFWPYGPIWQLYGKGFIAVRYKLSLLSWRFRLQPFRSTQTLLPYCTALIATDRHITFQLRISGTYHSCARDILMKKMNMKSAIIKIILAWLSAQNLTNLRIWTSLSCILQWPTCFIGVSLVLALNFSTHFSIKYPRAILSMEQLWSCRHSGHDQSFSPLDTSTKHCSQKLWPQWVVRTGGVKISEIHNNGACDIE